MTVVNAGLNPSSNDMVNLKSGSQVHGFDTVDVGDLRPTDTLIAVMGMTGAGKSTFIAHCTNASVPIGHGTQEVLVYPYRSKLNHRVYLVDTPGFDDTDRTDTQVLKEIATWLTDTFNEQVRLSGMIYLHRISDVRMQGSAKRNLFMFKKLCGSAAFKKVTLATTMWENNAEHGEAREKELINTKDFWGYMIDHGAKTYRHLNTRESALKLVNDFIGPTAGEDEKLVLNIQAEMQGGITLEETSAGKEFESQLREMKEHYLQELKIIKADQKEALAEHDRESVKALQEMQLDYDKKIENLNLGREQLRKDMEQLHQDREQSLIRRLQEQDEFVEKVKEQLVNANDQEKALLKEQIETAKKTNDHLQKQLTSIGQRIDRRRRATTQTYIDHGYNTMKRGCSLSVHNEYFVYRGHSNMRSNFESVADTFGNRFDSVKYFVFGENGSWYRHFHTDGNCHDLTSYNIDENYPGFRQKCFVQRKRSSCPTTVALGTGGEYFFAAKNFRAWHMNKEHTDFLQTCFSREEGETGGYWEIRRQWLGVKGIRRMWLGLEGSLVCLDYKGKLHCHNISEEPDSPYPGLMRTLNGEVLEGRKVKAIAMSLTDSKCWLAAWKYTWSYNLGQSNIDPKDFVIWCNANQGISHSAESAYALQTRQTTATAAPSLPPLEMTEPRSDDSDSDLN